MLLPGLSFPSYRPDDHAPPLNVPHLFSPDTHRQGAGSPSISQWLFSAFIFSIHIIWFCSCLPNHPSADCISLLLLSVWPLPQESDLLSLARSLLQAWLDPLLVLSTSSKTLPHPAQSSLSNKIQELQEHSKSLADGLDILSGKVCTCGEETPLKSCVFSAVFRKKWGVKTPFFPLPPLSLHLPRFLSSRWVQQLRPSPCCPTEEAITSVRTGFPSWPTSISCCPASAGTPTRSTASSRSYAAGQQKCDPRRAEDGAASLTLRGKRQL